MNTNESLINIDEAPIHYPTASLNTDFGVLKYRTYKNFIGHLRYILISGDGSHDIDLLRKSSQIDDYNKFVEVELFYYVHGAFEPKKVSITLALYVLNATLIAYRSENNSFFFKNAIPVANRFLFKDTIQYQVDLSTTNYMNLADRSKIPLSAQALRSATENLHGVGNLKEIPSSFKESLVVVLQMVVEAARFKFIKKHIASHLRHGYTPKGDTISYENNWIPLSDQIQQSGTDGIFKTPIQVQNADDSFKYITDVAQVKSDIAILLYEPVYPMFTYNIITGGDASDGGYGTLINTLRNNLISGGAISNDIPVLRKSSEITKDNEFVRVELFYYDDSISEKKVSITLAFYVRNVKFVGYKSEFNSFFFTGAPYEALDFLFNGTRKRNIGVNVSVSYDKLGVDTAKISLSSGALRKAIDILYKFDGKSIDDVNIAFKESLVVVMLMVRDALKFKFIQEYIELNLIEGYTPKGDTISYGIKWYALSKQIQLSDDGEFKKSVEVQNADNTTKIISNVDEIKPDIEMLVYIESKKIGEMSVGAADDEEQEEGWDFDE